MIDAFLRGASFAWEGRDDDDDDDGDDESTVKPSDASFVLLSFNWLIFHWCLRVGLDNGWTSMFGNGVKGKFVARECERKLNIQDKTVYAGSWKGFMCASVCVWWRREYLRRTCGNAPSSVCRRRCLHTYQRDLFFIVYLSLTLNAQTHTHAQSIVLAHIHNCTQATRLCRLCGASSLLASKAKQQRTSLEPNFLENKSPHKSVSSQLTTSFHSKNKIRAEK